MKADLTKGALVNILNGLMTDSDVQEMGFTFEYCPKEAHLKDYSYLISQVKVVGDNSLGFKVKDTDFFINEDMSFQLYIRDANRNLYPLYSQDDDGYHMLIEWTPDYANLLYIPLTTDQIKPGLISNITKEIVTHMERDDSYVNLTVMSMSDMKEHPRRLETGNYISGWFKVLDKH